MKKIIIVGGGPAAVSLCMQFLKKFNSQTVDENIEILVFEKNSTIGPGMPYSIVENNYILNLPKEVMEPTIAQAGNFARWLESSPTYLQKDTKFPPRHYFGDYLKYLAHALEKQTTTGNIKIKYHTCCEVLNVVKQGDQLEVITVKGNYKGDYLVFCTGHMSSTAFSHLIGQKGYIHSPYGNEEYIKKIPENDTVVIIGSRLTAIDAVLNLNSNNIYMISRSGLLPAVLGQTVDPYGLQYLTQENFDRITQSGLKPLGLNELMTLFCQEISKAENCDFNLNSIAKSYKDITPLAWLDKEITQAKIGNRAWQRVFFAFYPLVSIVWTRMNLTDQDIFLKNYYSLFLTYLAAFPLENAYKIRQLLQSKQLTVTGGLNAIEVINGKYQVKLDGNLTIKAEHVINATGPGYDPTTNPLYKNLANQGTIEKHPLGGLKVDHKTSQLFDKSNNLHKNMWAVGELTRGTFLATTDLISTAKQGNTVSNFIISQIKAAKKSTPLIRYPSSPSFFKVRKPNRVIGNRLPIMLGTTKALIKNVRP